VNASGEMPHVWLTRAGAHGQDEDVALDEQLAVIGFRFLSATPGSDPATSVIQKRGSRASSLSVRVDQ